MTMQEALDSTDGQVERVAIAYQLIERAALQLDDQDQESADLARDILDRLWGQLTQQERDALNARKGV